MTGPAHRAAVRGAAAVLASIWLLAAAATHAQTSNNEIDAAALRLSQGAIGHHTGDYEFTEAGGRTVRLADFRGKPVVLSLVFTQCYGVCSGLTLRLREAVKVAHATLGPGRFTVLTVGFDTKHDTPELMRAYGRDRGIDDADWHFVSADAETVRRLTDDIGFTYRPSAAGFDHVAQVTLLDRAGIVAGQLYGQDFEPPALVEPLRELVLGRGLGRASVSDLITRVRLYCSVYDPATGRYRFDFTMLASALPALLVLGIVALGLLAGDALVEQIADPVGREHALARRLDLSRRVEPAARGARAWARERSRRKPGPAPGRDLA